jgi:hypothetical protein
MNASTQPRTATRARLMWLVIAAVAILLAAAFSWDALRSSMAMSSAAASDEQDFAHATKGSTVKVVLEITASTSEGVMRGKLLEKQSEKVYERTPTVVTFRANSDAKIVMGKSDDIHPSAVIHLTGKLNDDRSVAASQIVILTGYVEIK